MTSTTAHARPPANVVVFDVGNVLLDWNPRYLFRSVMSDEAEIEWFLSEVCTPEWNLAQDAGRTWADAVAEATARYPEYAPMIRAYDEQWERTLGGPIEGTVTLLDELRTAGVPTYALTNFSAEKWPIAVKAYDFLSGFDGVVVSGVERVVKPDHAIYRRLLERYDLDPATTFYTDDVPTNVLAAREVGLQAQVFVEAGGLRDDLREAGLPL